MTTNVWPSSRVVTCYEQKSLAYNIDSKTVFISYLMKSSYRETKWHLFPRINLASLVRFPTTPSLCIMFILPYASVKLYSVIASSP